MNIYDKDETTILASPSISKEAVHEEELMRSNFVKLSWYSKERITLPVGSYIIPFADNVRYLLLDPYEPKAEKNAKFKYEPQFQHPIMWLGKLPFIHLEGDTTSWESATKKTDWTFYGTASTIASYIADFINLMSTESEDFGNVFGTGWTAVVDGDLPAVASLSFASLDILSAAAEMAQKYECEYHFDYEQKIFYLGRICFLRTELTPLVLKSGGNVGVTSISGSKEGYYNCFQVSGGKKNMTQEAAGNVVRSTNRLTLDEDDYPDSIIYTSEEGEIIDKEEFDESGSHMLIKQLVFDYVYPKMELYIYNLRERRLWLFEEDSQGVKHKIETTEADGWLDTTDYKYYKYYSKWYCRLAYQEDGVWHDYILTEQMQIPDTVPNLTFQLNGNDGAENTPLAGQEFNLVSYSEAIPEREYIEGEDIGNGIQPVQGDYRIEFVDGDIIIPTTSKQGVYPNANAQSEALGVPSDKNNIITLGNVIVDDIYKTIAQEELFAEAEKAILRIRSDLNSYSFQSNPIDFKKNSTVLYIGQKVIYNDGQDLVGGTSYELETRVQKIVTRLDHPEMVSIVVGNEKRKGSISSLKEDVKAIIAGGIGNGGGGSLTSAQFSQLIKNFGSMYFLSKINNDEAQGVIGFLRGAWFGAKQWVIDHLGNGVLNSLTAREQVMSDKFITSNYTGDGMFDTGGLFHYLNGKAKLVADMIVCRGKFIVNEIEDRIWTYAGGNLIFSSAGSTIFYVEYLDANGDALGYTYINSRWLLGGMRLLAGIIPWAKRRQIQRSLTLEERAQVVKFRCYEVADDGTMQTRNWWHVNDLAYCQTLNHVRNKIPASGGYSGALSNTVYVRRVAGIGSKKIPLINDDKIYDYVDLWNVYNVTGQSYVDSDGTTKTITDDVAGYDSDYSDWPSAGDVIVQRGNAVNEDRQGFSTIEVTGTQRGLKVYDNVDDYSMEGKKQAFLGYDADNKRAMLEVFGDAYIGAYGNPDPHNGNTYIRYNAQNGTLEIKAVINASSTINSKTIENYVNGLITQITDDIEAQVDRKAETYYQGTDPSSAWTTAAIKAEHVGDLWYCTATISGTNYKAGTTWRYNSNYQWEFQNIPSEVFDRIDGKAQIFIAKPTTKQTDGYCYRKNDLWILESAYTLSNVSYKAGTIVVAKSNATTWSASHWTKKDMYTDDSEVNALKANLYLQALLNGEVNEAIDDLEYLQEALDEDTVIDGGLMLTTIIGLRKKINGSYVTSGGIRAYDGDGTKIAAWFGGAMSDSGNNKAKIVFRHNGSGYLAGGNISWDASGNAEFAGEVTAESGEIGGFTISTNALGSGSWSNDCTWISQGHMFINNYSKQSTTFGENYALNIRGGAKILGEGQGIILSDTTENVQIYGKNTEIGAASKVKINDFLEVNAYADLKSDISVSGKSTLNGAVCMPSSLITGSGSKSLPLNPSKGQIVFVKGTTGQITVTSSNGIMNQADRSVSNSYSCQEKAMMFVFDGTNWLAFYCG